MTEYGFNPFSDSIKLRQNLSAFKKIERYTPSGTSTEIDVQNPILYLNESSIASPVFDGNIPKIQKTSLLWSIVDGEATIAATVGGMIKLYDNDTASYLWHTVTDIIVNSPESSINPNDILTPNYIIITFLGDGIDGSMRYDTPESTYVTTASESWGDKSLGTAGWILSSEGNSIFNNVAIRGEIEATSISINSNEAGDSTTTGIYWTGDPEDPLYIGSDVNILGTVTAEALTLNDYNYWTPTLTGAEFRVGGATSGILWDGSNLNVNGNIVGGNIGADEATGLQGWEVGTGYIASGSTTSYVALSSSSDFSSTYAIWAGGETASTAPFSVERDGTLNASNAVIEGEITATTIDVGGANGITYDGTTVTIGSDVTINADVTVQGLQITSETGGNVLTIDNNVSGTNDGIYINANNYWYTDGSFAVGNSTKSLVWDNTNLSLTGNIYADGGTIGNWTLNDEEIFSDISDTGNTYRTGIKASTGIGGGTYTPSIFYMVHDHDTAGAIPTFNSANTPFYADSNGRFSLADKLYFDQDIHGSGDNAQLVVIGKIRGQIENTELALDAIPNDNAKTITQIEITATDTAVITASTHGFAADDTVIISDLTTTTLNGAWKVFSVTTNTFTIKSDGLTVGAPYSDSGLARIRELTLGLHPAVGASPAGLGIRLDEYNYWFVNNKFRIGGSENYVDWSGSQLTVKGTINDLELSRGGGNIVSNFAVGINALDSNTTGSNNIALGQDALTSNISGSFNVSLGFQSLLNATDPGGMIAIGSSSLRSLVTMGGTGSAIAIGANALYSSLVGGSIAIGNNSLYSNTTGGSNVAIGNQALNFNTIGFSNVAIGTGALRGNTTGFRNVGIGASSLFSNTTGTLNVAIGDSTLNSNTIGSFNVAIGYNSLASNTTGQQNVAIGADSLKSNTVGIQNVAIGYSNLSKNTGGSYNIALSPLSMNNNTVGNRNLGIGYTSMLSNTTGSDNVAIGYASLSKNTVGASNLAIGTFALFSNTIASFNLGIGESSLESNTTGSFNTAIGYQSLSSNTTGSYNIAIGIDALKSNTIGFENLSIGAFSMLQNVSGNYNLAIGRAALTSQQYGEYNLAIGLLAMSSSTTGSDNLAIGSSALRLNQASYNLAIGKGSLYSNTVGEINLGIGLDSLASNTTGSYNLGIGNGALRDNQTGILNTAIGYKALNANQTSNNFAIGPYALNLNTTGAFNLALGNASLGSNTVGSNNVAIGESALTSNIDGQDNVAIGKNAGASNSGVQGPIVAIGTNALASNTTGEYNVAIGASSMWNNTVGTWNLAIGVKSLMSNTTGSNNVAIGYRSLERNVSGSNNLGIGQGTLYNNNGDFNLAIGFQSMLNNAGGSSNVGIGYYSLTSNTEGIQNVAIGQFALTSNTSGQNSIAIGYASLSESTEAVDNIAIGIGSLTSNTAGEYNMAIGNYALVSNVGGSENIAIGGGALSGTTTANNNIAIGLGSGAEITTGSNNVIIGPNTGSSISTSNNNIIISDGSGNIRIRSDSGGRVTMPQVPAFSVYSSNQGNPLSGNLVYNATNHNNGGYMNIGTGLFTAPVAGYYYFNYHTFIQDGLTGNTTITFQKNGSQIPSRAYNDENNSSYGPVISLSVVTFLAVNDNVRVNITGAGTHGNEASFFKGFLIG